MNATLSAPLLSETQLRRLNLQIENSCPAISWNDLWSGEKQSILESGVVNHQRTFGVYLRRPWTMDPLSLFLFANLLGIHAYLLVFRYKVAIKHRRFSRKNMLVLAASYRRSIA